MDKIINPTENFSLEQQQEEQEAPKIENNSETLLRQVASQVTDLTATGAKIFQEISVTNSEEKQEFSDIQKELRDLQENTQFEIERASETGEKTPENFIRAATLLLDSLRVREADAAQGYVFGYDRLVEKTSQGQDIMIDTLSWYSGSKVYDDEKQRLVLVASDANGQVVGLRLSDIQDRGLSQDENGEYFSENKVSGEILTKLRGQGIATALDRGYLEILTKIANDSQKYPARSKFNWVVENANLRRMNEKKQQGISEQELTELEEEQKRWQAIYGENGKLGFKKNGENEYMKIIEPDAKEGQAYAMRNVSMEEFKKTEEGLQECIKQGNL